MLNFDAFTYFANLLVICLVIYVPYRLMRQPLARRLLLTLSGAYLLFLIAPRLLLFYLIFWGAIAIFQPIVHATGEHRHALVPLLSSILIVAAPMVIWKIWATDFIIWFNLFFADSLDRAPLSIGPLDSLRDIVLPIGLSFATFRAIDLLIQSSLGIVDRLTPGRILFFGFFPPVQIIGPIIEYTEIGPRAEQTDNPDFEDYRHAFFSVVIGLFKIFVLAFPLESSTDVFFQATNNNAAIVWFELAVFAWYLYLNFSGFSDLAIGIARLFGFKLKPNFDRPYSRTNPQEFWTNWHMSLTRFAQRNVFIPLGGMRQSRQYVAIAATMMLIALWHDISLSLILFGLWHSAGLIIWRIVSGRRPAQDRPSWMLRGGKSVMQFAFYITSLPLLMLKLDAIPGFYASLLGLS